jgi:hypothetical protein
MGAILVRPGWMLMTLARESASMLRHRPDRDDRKELSLCHRIEGIGFCLENQHLQRSNVVQQRLAQRRRAKPCM